MNKDEKEREFNSLFEALTIEFARNESQYGRVVINQATREVFWPESWLEVMRSPGWIDGFSIDPSILETLELCRPLDLDHLSPMSDLLRELATKCGLPHYEGRSYAPPQLGPEVPRWQRCPQCGSKMKAKEEVEWAKSRQHHFGMNSAAPIPTEVSGVMKCAGCGHEI